MYRWSITIITNLLSPFIYRIPFDIFIFFNVLMVITNWQPFNFLCISYLHISEDLFQNSDCIFMFFWRYQWSTKPLWYQFQFVHYSLESFNNIFIRIKIKYSWKVFHWSYKYLLEKYIFLSLKVIIIDVPCDKKICNFYGVF